MKGKSDAKWKLAAAKMPPLRKSQPEFDYAPEFDATYDWIARQPDIMQMAFNRMRDSGVIIYDKETGTWRGRDYGA